jgi:2-aminobenzoate-CoA ligase
MDEQVKLAGPGGKSAYVDMFVRDRLPPRELWPDFDYARMPDGITYPDRLNVTRALLDDAIANGFGDNPAVHFDDRVWSYRDLQDLVDRIARVLTEDYGLVPGNRVLLRGPNTPMLMASWLAAVKAGGVCVTTMPLLRAPELVKILGVIDTDIVLCDAGVADELEKACRDVGGIDHIGLFSQIADEGDTDFDRAVAGKTGRFEAVDTAADDPAILAFTSGTTGQPKCAVQFHRDLMVATDCFPRDIWDIQPHHVFAGSPPIAFTFGCGAFILIPLRYGASSALIATPSPENLLKAVERHRVSDLYTAPTMYRRMAEMLDDYDISSLKHCNAAGEHLAADTFERWRDKTGLAIVDAIGSTEMFHNFMASPVDRIRPGSTGRPVQGYEAKLLDDNDKPAKTGEIGRLAIRGPNGCLYLDNPERQKDYVRDRWNFTGDLFSRDEDGYYWYAGRADDLIVSSGYNISGIEVEQVLLTHDSVNECAVVGLPDQARGNVVAAFIIPTCPIADETALTKELQNYVKATIAPYKYPRRIEFIEELPRTPTGKVQRFKLQSR